MFFTTIKESFDKMPNYSFKLDYKDIPGGFNCYFYVNGVNIVQGQGTNKLFAKHDAAKKAHELLLDCDYEFAVIQGMPPLKEDYLKKLQQFANQHNILLQIEADDSNPNIYQPIQIKCGIQTQISFHFNKGMAIQFGCYKLLEYFKNYPIENELNKKNKASPQIRIVIQKNNIKDFTKMEEETFAPIVRKLTPEDFYSNLSIDEEVYEYFDTFLNQLKQQDIFTFYTVGSYNTKSIRILKPSIDLIVIINQQFIQFEKYLEQLAITKNLKIVRDKKHFQLEFPDKLQSKELKWIPQNIVANIYIKKKLSIQQHDDYMRSFKPALEKYRQAIQCLQFAHQWRDDRFVEIPTKILDYLVVSVTNEFQNISNPMQVLRQIIFLLQQNILQNMINQKQDDFEEVNPFVLSPPLHQIILVKKIENRDIIINKAQEWNKEKIEEWVSFYCK